MNELRCQHVEFTIVFGFLYCVCYYLFWFPLFGCFVESIAECGLCSLFLDGIFSVSIFFLFSPFKCAASVCVHYFPIYNLVTSALILGSILSQLVLVNILLWTLSASAIVHTCASYEFLKSGNIVFAMLFKRCFI